MSLDSQMASRQETDMDASLRWHDGKEEGRTLPPGPFIP